MAVCHNFLISRWFIGGVFFLVSLILGGAPVRADILTSSVTITQALTDNPGVSGNSVIGGGQSLSQPTRVILEGLAYPQAELSLLLDGILNQSIIVGQDGHFRQELENLEPGVYTVSLFAKDADGIKSATITYTLTVVAGMTVTLSTIYLPPTIEMTKDNLLIGEQAEIFGQAAPETEIHLHVIPEKTTDLKASPIDLGGVIEKVWADSHGDWRYLLDTTNYEAKVYRVRARLVLADKLYSSFSEDHFFYLNQTVTAPDEAVINRGWLGDFNRDGRIGLIDFFILLYWWGQAQDSVDIDRSGEVDLVDFSILLYHWTG